MLCKIAAHLTTRKPFVCNVQIFDTNLGASAAENHVRIRPQGGK